MLWSFEESVLYQHPKAKNFLIVDLRKFFFRFRVSGDSGHFQNSKTSKVNQQSVLNL